MGREEEYRRNAEDAERLAREARFEAERRGYQKIAEGWRELVAEAERVRKRR